MQPSVFHDLNYLDFHTHSRRQLDRADVVEIISIHLGQEKDARYFTVGLHPWWTPEPVTPEQRAELTRQLSSPGCLAMGEMGLDNLKGPVITLQMEVLREQLTVAQDLGKPVIIHCVRAFDQLIRIKKEYPGIQKWCIHGYGRHVTLARQLIDQGFYLSLMPSPASKYQDWWAVLPHDRLFLETDSMPQASIAEVYEQVSDVANLELNALKRQMNQNARDFFGQ